jgi:hypothetical protein
MATVPSEGRRAQANTPAADRYVLSYPKTGRTWLRALVGRVLVDRLRAPESYLLDIPALTGAAGLPVTAFDHDGSELIHAVRWQALSPDKSRYRGKRVLLLGRDVRDTLVSSYFQASRRIRAFEGSIAEFVRSDRFGARKIAAFYRHWQAARDLPDAFLFLRYEALHADPSAVLAEVLDFLGVRDVPAPAIAAAVEFARFDNLRSLESSGRIESMGARSGPMLSTPADADPETFKVRRGKVGGFRDYLTDEDVAWIDAVVAEADCPFLAPAA